MASSSDAARKYSRAQAERFPAGTVRDAAHPQPQRRPGPRRRHPARGGVAGGAPARPWHRRTSRSCRPPATRSSTASGWAPGRTSRPCWSTATTTWCRRSLEDGWETPPFEPVVKDGKIYARGATDDKGQLFIHVKALESYLKTGGAAPVNVKFLLEGEEEVSSPNLRALHRSAPRPAQGRRLRHQRLVDARRSRSRPSPTACAA